MADPLLGFNLASQGVNLTSSSTTLSSLSAQASKPLAFDPSGITNTFSASGAGGGAPLFRYPLKRIDASSDYLEIKILKYKAAGFTLGTNPNNLKIGSSSDTITNTQQSPLAYIQLPIPQNISETQTTDWGDDRLDPYSAFLYSKASELIGSGSELLETGQKVLTDAANQFNNTFVTGNGTNLFRSNLAASAAGQLGGNVSTQSILGRSTGQVVNPNLELLFNGPSIRTFPFSFEFAPREPAEGQAVRKIIWTLKKHMVTKRDGTGLFLNPPDVFQLTYKTGNRPHPFLNKFKPAALLNLDVNYTGSGTYATYNDATPIHITMTLTFKELNPIYEDNYQESDTNVGY